jgi:hypothetical protein
MLNSICFLIGLFLFVSYTPRVVKSIIHEDASAGGYVIYIWAIGAVLMAQKFIF